MQFTAIGVAALPDIVTARGNFSLQDLSDEDVAKVLFHRRKQCGSGDTLGWDQLAFGAVSLVVISTDNAHIETLTLNDRPEHRLLDAIFHALQDSPPLVTWGGTSSLLPLLQFRCLKHRRSAGGYWAAVEQGHRPHIDLQQELLAGTHAETPSLDDLAQRLGLPGMLGRSDGTLWDRWLKGEHQALAEYSDYQAINTALLAPEIFHLKGGCSLAELEAMQEMLTNVLAHTQPVERYRELLAGRGQVS